MLICVCGQYFEAEPVPEPEGDFDLVIDNDRAILTKGGKKIEYGPIYFSYGSFGSIDAVSGKFCGKPTKYRVVFNGKHFDFTV